MPVLSNPRHERFAQELAKGKSADEAYAEAGYKPNRGNACALKAKQHISKRLAELQERLFGLQEAAVKRSEVTLERLTSMLLEDREFAYQCGQSAAAVSAVEKIGKLHGYFVERKEVGKPGDFDRMTEDELRRFLDREGKALRYGLEAAQVPGNKAELN